MWISKREVCAWYMFLRVQLLIALMIRVRCFRYVGVSMILPVRSVKKSEWEFLVFMSSINTSVRGECCGKWIIIVRKELISERWVVKLHECDMYASTYLCLFESVRVWRVCVCVYDVCVCDVCAYVCVYVCVCVCVFVFVCVCTYTHYVHI